ncbi:MAG: hypothetical protein Q8K57_19020 [Thiobacillus sp.]|nr:hypothetical protein [Gammaproteobacteria bacterium]MBU4499790.1 hypothetical protein [Gammaproteobacteria bacterium]MDO9006868.1 hypothetical protein [Thiobacillus sp.]MDP1926864.1 hypothetical protein [Thiobacillus sp.]MDP3126851.1 hypothetical protein [Thiobacillus sp.]
MESRDLLRHQIIDSLITHRTEKVADAAMNVWEKLATEIISVVGEDGFNSLYERSVFLAQRTFPWLAAHSLSPQSDHRFAELKIRLAEQTPVEARVANILLLITFTDILTSLIGEALTTRILRSAWGSEEFMAGHPNDISNKVGKEFDNE